jgi:hypothetical protein
MDFMQDLAERVIGLPQINTDAHKPYLKSVEEAFGGDGGYAMLHKVYGYTEVPGSRYSPATCIWLRHEDCQRHTGSQTCHYELRRAPGSHHAIV